MGQVALLALRLALVVVLAGTLFVQVFLVPVMAVDFSEVEDPTLANLGLPGLAVLFLVLVFLGVVAAQVVLVCIWRLLTMVRRGTVFSHAAFRFVDVVIVAIGTASVLMFAIACVLAPGEAAPGLVLLVCIASVAIAGAALLVYVLRLLLAQAVARDAEAQHLQSELDEVI